MKKVVSPLLLPLQTIFAFNFDHYQPAPFSALHYFRDYDSPFSALDDFRLYDSAPFSALDDFLLYDSANLNDFLGNEAFSHHFYAIYGQN